MSNDNARRLISRAFSALGSGDFATAERIFGQFAQTPPADAETMHALGVLACRLGRFDQAEVLLSEAARLLPDSVAVHGNLANALRHLGRAARAAEHLRRALQLDPRIPELHCNLGNVRLDLGEFEQARDSFERALALRADFADAICGVGCAQLALGRPVEAVPSFERAVALDPGFHEARSNLAVALESFGRLEEAFQAHCACLLARPDVELYWTRFAACLGMVRLREPLDPELRDILPRVLEHPAVDPSTVAGSLLAVVESGASYRSVAAGLESASEDPAALASAWNALEEPILRALLANCLVAHRGIERLIAFARRGALRELTQAPGGARPPLAALAAMAHQCFSTEYVCAESAEEEAAVAALQRALGAQVASGSTPPSESIALLACYRPLGSIDASGALAGRYPEPVNSLVARQVLEPLEEARVAGSVPALGVVDDAVSSAVRRQYESNPYPRWVRTARTEALARPRAVLAQLFPWENFDAVPDSGLQILVAGCGTGKHPIDTAHRFVGSEILAVDLSRASLAYALRKSAELGLARIRYLQADLLQLGSIGERFHVIECTGVLHHLAEPLAGWRVLKSLLAPQGLMRIGLYSELARRHVVRARELARSFAATPQDIRRFRARVRASGDDDMIARLERSEDFFSVSGCRDLMFHVQEHRFTLPRIASMIDELGLDFLGFELRDPTVSASYRSRFAEDPERRNLARWHAYEEEFPDTFSKMYQFWVRARD